MVYTISSGVHPEWSTPRGVVHTTSSGAHPEWSTPSAVVYTQSGPHPKWSTPSAVVYTQSSPHHEAWSTPPVVVHTQSGLHHQQWSTPKVVHTTSVIDFAHDYLTNLSILCPYSRRYSWQGGILQFYLGDNNAYVSIIWLIIHFQQTQSVIQIASHKPSQIISNFLRSRHFGPSVNHHGRPGREPYL